MSFNRTGLELLNKPEADLKSTLMEKMSELDELNRYMKQRAQDTSKSPDRSGGPSQPRDLYQSDFGHRIGHDQQSTLRTSFQPFAYHQQQ